MLQGLLTRGYSNNYILQNLSYLIACNYHSWPNCLFGIRQRCSQKFSQKNKKLHIKSIRLMKCKWRFNNFSCFAPIILDWFILLNQSNIITLTRAITGIFFINSLISMLRSPVITVLYPFQTRHINESIKMYSTLLLPIVSCVRSNDVWINSICLILRIKCFHFLKFPWLGLMLHNCAWFRA